MRSACCPHTYIGVIYDKAAFVFMYIDDTRRRILHGIRPPDVFVQHGRPFQLVQFVQLHGAPPRTRTL